MKILVTGACGFVGSRLIRRILAQQADVQIWGVDNLSRAGSESNRPELRRLGVKFIHADVRLASDFEGLPPCDWVIDAAANPSVLAGLGADCSGRQLLEHNLWGTVNLLEYCRRHQAGLILLSTSRVYSISAMTEIRTKIDQGSFVFDDLALQPAEVGGNGLTEAFSTEAPLSLYGASKKCSELLALEYAAAYGLRVWINRCGVMAGAGQFGKADQGIFSFWLHSYLHRRPLRYIGFDGQGHQARDCLHPDDLADLILQQISFAGPPQRNIFNVGGGRKSSYSLAQLSGWCQERWGRHEVGSDPNPRPFDIPWLILDPSSAEQVWSWRPQRDVSSILEEIALHAEGHPNWLEQTGAN